MRTASSLSCCGGFRWCEAGNRCWRSTFSLIRQPNHEGHEDFYSIDEETGRHLGKLRRHCDLVACQVADPLELALPPAGRYGITDGERTGVLDTRSQHGQRGYEAYLARHQSTIRNLTSGRGIPLVHFPTDEDPVAHLAAGLEQLGRRQAGRLEAAA